MLKLPKVLPKSKRPLVPIVALLLISGALILGVRGLGGGSNYPPVDVGDARITTDDEVLRGYLDQHGADKAIALIKATPAVDCHQRVHKVGRLSYELHGTDAFKLLNSECMSGYTHGVTEAFFHEHGTADLEKNLAVICQDEQNGFYAHQCYHGIGHGLMAYSDYDLPAALRDCDTLPHVSTHRDSCYSGAFMENVVGAIAEDEARLATDASDIHVSSYLSDDPHHPCTAVDEKYRSSCYFFQSSRMIEIFDYNYRKVVRACESIDSQYQQNCFMSTGRDVSNTFHKDYTGIEKSCAHAKDEAMEAACISGASQDKFWHVSEQDEAIEMCKALARETFKARCYYELNVRGQDIVAGAGTRRIFCDKFEPNYKYLCTLAS
jgi:hypothetical protein